MRSAWALAWVLTICFVAARAHAAPPTAAVAPNKIQLNPFPADGKPATFALPNSGGAGALDRTGTLTFRGQALDLNPAAPKTVEHPDVRRWQMFTDGERLYFVLEHLSKLDPSTPPPKLDAKTAARVDPELGAIVIAAIDLGSGRLAWKERISNSRADKSWALYDSPSTLFAMTFTGVYALAKPTGNYLWIWYQDAHDSGLNGRYLLDWKFEPKTDSIVFTTQPRVDFEMYPERKPMLYELDAATGTRVYRTLKAPKIEPRAFYTYHFQRVEYPGDRPAPREPADFTGLWMERTILWWNKRTNEGIVLNPEAAILSQIVAVAQQQRANGKPISWKYVVDLDAASAAFPKERMRAQVLAGYKDPVGAGDEILAWPLGEFHFSGEKIVAAECAKALGAAILPSPTPGRTELKAAPFFVFRDDHVHERASLATNDYGNHLKVKWGPYVLYQFTRDWSVSYFKMEP